MHSSSSVYVEIERAARVQPSFPFHSFCSRMKINLMWGIETAATAVVVKECQIVKEKEKKADDDDDGWGANEWMGKGEKLLVKINCFLF